MFGFRGQLLQAARTRTIVRRAFNTSRRSSAGKTPEQLFAFLEAAARENFLLFFVFFFLQSISCLYITIRVGGEWLELALYRVGRLSPDPSSYNPLKGYRNRLHFISTPNWVGQRPALFSERKAKWKK